MIRLIALLSLLAWGRINSEEKMGDSLVPAAEPIQVFQVPEPGRMVLLVVGIGALTLTYRRFWVNMREKFKN